MKFFLDTEFIESGHKKPIQLISIALVCEDGREFYAVSNEFDPLSANEWVTQNVLSKLNLAYNSPKSLEQIKEEILSFVSYNGHGLAEKPEFWGYYADYDWVVFCQLFGAMINLPKGYPMYCRDIKQLCDSLGNPRIMVEPPTNEHNALQDAIWNKRAYEWLVDFSKK